MRLLFLFILFSSSFSFGQLPKNVLGLVGEWNYKKGSGLEVWEKVGSELKGKEIRINKLGDSIVVERMTIRFVNNQLSYLVEVHDDEVDSLIYHEANHFVSRNKRMKFLNIDSNVPVSIEYKFGFINRNKVKIKIQFSRNDKAVKLLMYRSKL